MQYWLMKSEPDVWSIEQQKKAGGKGVAWDGVRNYQAAKNMKSMKIGDLGFFYHSVNEKQIVGIVEIIKEYYPDLKFCGDNAAMIAWAGIQRFKKNMVDDITVSAKSRWPLDKNAPYMKGPGLKL